MSSFHKICWDYVLDITRKPSVMWDLLIYIGCVLTYIWLYWFRPKYQSTTSSSDGTDSDGLNQRTKSTERISTLPNTDSPTRLRERAMRRLASFRKKKELVEKDIITKLGLNLDENEFEAFHDKFPTVEAVSSALVMAGFQNCDLIIGVDFTASNEWQGRRTFSRKCLHKTNGTKIYNPYQRVLQIIGRTLSFINRDHLIYSYGFGDSLTKDKAVFPLSTEPISCQDYQQVIDAYTSSANIIKLGGPSSLAPIIKQAINLCRTGNKYHILILIVDGQVSSSAEDETVNAIVEASNYPLSIIVIGIGDGPFGTMFEYDDGLPRRKFDNLQFVNFHRTVTRCKHEAAFALHALMEIPDQYQAIQQLGLLSHNNNNNHQVLKKNI